MDNLNELMEKKTLSDLKAEAYDLIGSINALTQRLKVVQNEIQLKMKETQDDKVQGSKK